MHIFEFKKKIESHGNVYTCPMSEVKEIIGCKRLGKVKTRLFSNDLNTQGIAHLPNVLPTNENESVRFYITNTTIANTIIIVSIPDPTNDKRLREFAKKIMYEEINDNQKGG
jgi:hypothetical protein